MKDAVKPHPGMNENDERNFASRLSEASQVASRLSEAF
jgi:hypothetical protein